MNNADVVFIEQTLFLIFLWIGAWGLTDLVLTHASVRTKVILYSGFLVLSLVFLYLRGHAAKMACV